MKCKIEVYNYKTKQPDWIEGVITGTIAGDVGEDFERINVLVNGINYIGCHPDCVKIKE